MHHTPHLPTTLFRTFIEIPHKRYQPSNLYNTCPVNLPYFKSPTDLVGHYGPKQTSKHLFPFSIYSPALNCATCKTLLLVQEGEIKDSNKTASTTHKCFFGILDIWVWSARDWSLIAAISYDSWLFMLSLDLAAENISLPNTFRLVSTPRF